MIVVSDTSPLNYLIQINLVDILRQLYGRVFVPHEVHAELLADGALKKVRTWALTPPEWFEIRSAIPVPRPEIETLDSGEQAAITLALEMHADRLLADERKARRIAHDCFGLKVTGTLGVLREAHFAGLLKAPE
ncbi:MAG: DUF3368 domain-containing protein, partial [Acidobacteriota bacterium]